MKVKRKSVFFRGLMLLVAFALSVACFPVGSLLAFAATGTSHSGVDFSFMTLSGVDSSNHLVVTKNDIFNIPKAYIGGDEGLVVGEAKDEQLKGATLLSSKVEVSYNGVKIVSSEDEDPAFDWTFTAARQGTYVVTYSYKFDKGGETFENSYSINVESQLSSASINFSETSKVVMPSLIDRTLAKTKVDGKDTYRSLILDIPEVWDENGDVVDGVVFGTSKPSADALESLVGKGYVIISAQGGKDAGAAVDVKPGADGTFVIDGDNFKDIADGGKGVGTYTIKYSYYSVSKSVKDNSYISNFVTSQTKEVEVKDNYYKDYDLKLVLSADWQDNGETGVTKTLPAAQGVTTSDTDPANASVDVAYKVEVLFTSSKSDSAFAALNTDLYTATGDDAVLYKEGDHYYLQDPTSFKPLEDGYYRFIYTITDFYGNSKTSSAGAYEWENIKDEQSPTPIIYDASNPQYDKDGKLVSENHKLASQTAANGVVVYAIDVNDNVSTAENSTLIRKIMTDETVVKLIISGYNKYNLVFNYSGSDAAGEHAAYENLYTNDYYVRKLTDAYEAKATAEARKEDADAEAVVVNSNASMLTNVLKPNNYLIVIDKGNYKNIYSYFEDTFKAIEGATIASADDLLAWLEANKADEAKIAGLGFAYVYDNGADKNGVATFGATTSEGGMGTGKFYVHYIAKDVAGLETDTYQQMYITNTPDSELPTIKFSTTLQTAYTPNSVIKFSVPTASDGQDSYMLVKTLYRFLDDENKVVNVYDGEEKEENKLSTENLNTLWEDLGTGSDGTYVGGQLLTKKYAEYAGDGYVDLTDKSLSTYSIDLSNSKPATKVQIVVYVYDDYGNANMYAISADIANANDEHAPEFASFNVGQTEFGAGDTIEIPNLVVYDDKVPFMNFDVNVTYTTQDKDGKDVSTTIKASGNSAERKNVSASGMGEFVVNGGNFVASGAGTYNVYVVAKDAAGNAIVAFANYTVEPRVLISEPSIKSSLEKTQTLELDDFDSNGSIELPAPTVSYDIDASVTYDEYVALKAQAAEETDKTSETSATKRLQKVKYVVYGVDVDGKPYDYSTTYGQNGYLKPRELGVGEYEIVYTVNLKVYDPTEFEYSDWAYNGTNYVKSSFTDKRTGGTGLSFTFDGADTIKVSTYSIKLDKETDALTITDANGAVKTANDVKSGLTDAQLKSLFEGVKAYSLDSETYYVTIQDTKAPVIADFEYPTAIAKKDLENNSKLTIHGIETKSDASGINRAKSKITVSYKLATGTSGSEEKTGEEAFTGFDYSLSSTTVDGTYTITYTVYDNENNYSTKTYTIAVGDNVAPTITVKDKFANGTTLKDSYELSKNLTLKLDLTEIDVVDNNKMPDDAIPTVTLRNTSTGEEIKLNEENSTDTLYVYDLTEVGSYTITITVDDTVGNTATKTLTFEVVTHSTNPSNVHQVVGIVLIVVSVLVLAGVIIYFVVSKVKLDKELKK